MKVKLSLGLLVVTLTAATAFAQTGVAGKWIGELSAADGHGVPQPITVELKVDGETLSGTVTEGALEARPIMSASMDGNAVTFRTVRNLSGSDINVNWKGELKGDDLSLTREVGPAPAEAAGGRGGRGGGAGAGAAGAGRGGRGGAAAGGQRGAVAVPPVPAVQDGTAPDTAGAPAAAAGGRGGGRGGAAGAAGGRGGARGGAPPAAAGGGAPGQAPGGRGAAAPSGPTVSLTLHRAR